MGDEGSFNQDKMTDSHVDVTQAHHEIHDGHAFKCDINTEDLKNEGDNNALHISFTTSNTTKWNHLFVTGWGSGAIEVSLNEAPSGGVAGGSTLNV